MVDPGPTTTPRATDGGGKHAARHRHILHVTIGYGVIAALWILLSDALLAPVLDPAAMQWLSTVKGLFFVIVTTLLLFFALRATPDRPGAVAATPETILPAAAPWSGAWAYLFAGLVTLATLLVRIAIPIPFGERPMMVLFMLPVIISAMAGGLGPGLIATLTAALAIDYFALAPFHSLRIDKAHDLFQWSFLVANGVLVSALSEVLHRLRRQTEASRLLQAVTLASIGDGVIATDNAGRITFMNPEAERLTGWSGREAMGLPLSEVFCLVSELEHQPVADPVQKVLASGKIVELDNRTLLLTRDGRELPIHDSGAPIRLANGTLLGVVLIFRDDTQRRQAETTIRRSEQTYRSLYDNMLNSVVHARMIFVDDIPVDMEYLAVNPAFAKVSGITAEVVGRRISEVIANYARDNQESLEVFGRVALSGEPTRWEHYLAALDRWFSFSIYSPVRGEVIIVTDNISEQKKAELALRENEARLRSISDNLPDGYIYQSGPGPDGKSRFLYISAGVTEIHGLTPEEVMGDASLLYRQVDPSQIAALGRAERQSLVDSTDFSFEVHVRRPDATWRWLYVRSRPRRKADGQLVWDGVATDITARKAMEGQLLQAQKMEFVGRLAGGVAHDFNNMLTVIGGHAELALGQTSPDDPRYLDLQEIQNAARRSANLTHQLLAFARKQTVSPVVLDMNDTLAAMLKMLQRLIGEDIDLAWLPGHDLWQVKIDPSQIDQLLANLAVNARDAIAGVGKVTIETDNREFDASYCAQHQGFSIGKYVVLSVSDNGCGMNEEVLQHIFEPFFTTKEEGKGTGLGLATVYGIIKQNRGFINVYSEPGQGTTFRIYLPRLEESADVAKEQTLPTASPGGSETVLIVEDDVAILGLGQRFAEKLGYRVLSATSPGAALRLLGDYAGVIDLLITDVIMPEMNGKELAAQLKQLRPGLKCLFMSGYTADVIARQGVLDKGICFLAKPFSSHELAVKIREALGQKVDD